MWDVADSNDSPGQRPAHDRSPAESPEIVDAEVVEEHHRPDTSREPAASPPDDEEYRQYREFLEFRKFQEWQRQHDTGRPGTDSPPAGDPPPTGTSAPRRPMWKKALRLLRFKFVRRLLYLVLALLLINAGINYYFGTDDGGLTDTSTPDDLGQGQSPIRQTDPKAAVIALYDYVATKPGEACRMMDEPTRAWFARSHGAPDCDTAVRRLNRQVTNPKAYKLPGFERGALAVAGKEAQVSSCALTVRGGPRLGAFGLSREPNKGWVIDGYELEPHC